MFLSRPFLILLKTATQATTIVAEQKRQRIHEYDDNDSDGNDNDDNDYTITTITMIPNMNTSEDKHDDVDHDDDDHSNVDGDGATFYFDCTSAPSSVEYRYAIPASSSSKKQSMYDLLQLLQKEVCIGSAVCISMRRC